MFADVNSAEPVFEAVHENTGYEEKHEEPTQEEKEEGREPLAEEEVNDTKEISTDSVELETGKEEESKENTPNEELESMKEDKNEKSKELTLVVSWIGETEGSEFSRELLKKDEIVLFHEEGEILIQDYYEKFEGFIENKSQYLINYKGFLLSDTLLDSRKEGSVDIKRLRQVDGVYRLEFYYALEQKKEENQTDLAKKEPTDLADAMELEKEEEAKLLDDYEKLNEEVESTAMTVNSTSEATSRAAGTENITKTQISSDVAFYWGYDTKTQTAYDAVTSTMAYFTLPDGGIAFCLNPGLHGPEGNLTSEIFKDSDFRRFAEGVATVGVASGGLSGYSFEKNFAFAQMYIWQNIPYDFDSNNTSPSASNKRYKVEFRNPYEWSDNTYVEPGYEDWKSRVSSTISSLGKVSFDGQLVKLEVGEEKRLTDTSGQLHKFNLRGVPSGLSAKIEGDTLVLKASKPLGQTTLRFSYSSSEHPSPEISFLLNQPDPTYQDLGYFRDPFALQITVKADISSSHVSILKKDENGAVVPGVVFELSQNSNFRNSKKVTTGSSGTALSEDWNLANGSIIYVREVSVPDKYILDRTVKQVTLIAGKTVSVEFTNRLKPGIARIKKIDSTTGDPVDGATLELIEEDTGKVIASWTTNKSNQSGYVVKDLVVGKKYLVIETKTPAGYLEPQDRITVIVTQGNDVEEFTFKNDPTPEIKTSASFEDGTKQNKAEKTKLIDVVSYEKLVPGKSYTLKGKLVNGSNASQVIASGETTFTPKNSSGEVNVTFYFDASVLAGETLVVFEDLYKDGIHLASHSEITDKKQTVYIPKIETSAKDKADGGKEMLAGKEVTVVDTVKYENLIPGKSYTVKGVLMDQSTGEKLLVGGREVVAQKSFSPTEKTGVVELEFRFDGSNLRGKTLVIFERLFSDGKEVALHADLSDENQTIYIPKISTSAADKQGGGKQLLAKDEATIIDTIRYENLTPGKTYRISGVLIDQTSGEKLLIGGKEVRSEKTFIAQTKDGEEKLEFSFDANRLNGATLVVFEQLFQDKKLVAVHHDISDEGQTIYIPKIATRAEDEVDGCKDLFPGENATIRDILQYENLLKGKSYTVKGVLMLQSTGEILLIDGKEVIAEKTFTAADKSGEVILEFVFNASDLKGETIVVFENLYLNDKLVASHADIKDTEQSIFIPRIETEAKDKMDGGKHTLANEKAEIIDSVKYSNLMVGKTYTVKGVLMDQTSGEKLLVDGKEVAAERTFTATSTSGEIDLVFIFNAQSLKGKTLVVFEDLYQGKKHVASHSDITDECQTIYIPKIGTSAKDKADGGKDLFSGEGAVIVDTVKYTNLIVGEEYRIKGVLIDQSTGENLLIGGKEVTSEGTFTARSAEGQVELEFRFDASGLDGKTIVVFEDLYKNGKIIATHRDITDKEQTVFIPKIRTSASDMNGGGKNLFGGKTTTIIDMVKYENLVIGKTYTVKGVLMDKYTGNKLLVGGKEVTAEKMFTAESRSGKIELEFTFDGSGLSGRTLVVFEDLYQGEKHVASHSDISDEDQTMYLPNIATIATSSTFEKEVLSQKEVEIIDEVRYTNLLPGTMYTIKGSLIDKKTGNTITTAEITFVAEKEEGSVFLPFSFDASKYEGKEVVVFEELYESGKLLASHKDLDDKDQTVRVLEKPRLPETGHANKNHYLLRGTSLLLLGFFLLRGPSKEQN